MSRHGAVCLALGMIIMAGSAQALDQFTFGTNWKARAEHGGFSRGERDPDVWHGHNCMLPLNRSPEDAHDYA